MSITPGIVVFDPDAFTAAFPAFSTVPDAVLTANFNFATLQLNNTLGSVVQDEPTRAQLLNLLTAHITALLNGVNGQPPSGVVGRISNATEGSVSMQADFDTKSFSEAYYAQTPWGVAYWQSTVAFRSARYISLKWAGVSSMQPWDAWPQ